MTSRLTPDQYTNYVSEYYVKGLEVCGRDWGFMDLVTVLYAIAEMGQPQNYLDIGDYCHIAGELNILSPTGKLRIGKDCFVGVRGRIWA